MCLSPTCRLTALRTSFRLDIEAEFAQFCEPSEKKFNAEDRVAPAANADESYTAATAQQSSSPKL
jgi:hypothetical protein